MADTENNKNSNSPAERAQDRNEVSSHAERRAKAPQGNSPAERAQGNAPALRFPGFTEPWKKTTLGNCCGEMDYGMNAPAKEYDGVNKYIRITDIDENSSEYNCASIVSPDGTLLDKYLVNENDILFARTGSSTGKAYLYRPTDGRLYFAGFLIRANVKDDNESNFIYHQCKLKRYWNWVRIMSARSGQPGINSQEYSTYTIYSTSKEEQIKISSLLNLLDERIATQRRLIEKFETLIKGIAEFLTTKTPNTKIADCLVCHSSTLQENQVSPSGEYRVYGASGICGYTDSPEVADDSILIVKDGSGVGTVTYASGEYSVIGTSNYLTAKNGYLLRYLYYCLMCFNFTPYKTGMAIPHIYFKDYGKAKIYCPDIEEQRKIAAALSSIESKIEIERTILQQHAMQKQYLLFQMFI